MRCPAAITPRAAPLFEVFTRPSQFRTNPGGRTHPSPSRRLRLVGASRKPIPLRHSSACRFSRCAVALWECRWGRTLSRASRPCACTLTATALNIGERHPVDVAELREAADFAWAGYLMRLVD